MNYSNQTYYVTAERLPEHRFHSLGNGFAFEKYWHFEILGMFSHADV